MTSLKQQLNRLQASASTPVSKELRKRPSLLFDASEAADIPLDAVFTLGNDGLEELSKINSSLLYFRENLFKEEFLRTSRINEGKSFNAQLSKLISQCLYMLSPFFLLKPTVKCLEWLIWKYEITKHETDVILCSFFPYHETRLFGRLLQLLDVSKEGERWNWLKKSIKEGHSVSKLTVARRCKEDKAFLDFICNMPVQAEKALLEHEAAHLQTVGSNTKIDRSVDVLRSFAISIVVTVLQSITVFDEELIGILLPRALKDLKSTSDNTVIGAYVILTLLVQKVSLNKKSKRKCFNTICSSLRKGTYEKGLLILAVLAKFQEIKNIKSSTLQLIMNIPGLIRVLSSMGKEHDISALMTLLLTQLVINSLVSVENTEVADSNEGGKEGLAEFQLVNSLVKHLDVPMQIALTFLRKIMELFKSHKEDQVNLVPSFAERMREFAELIEKKHPTILEHVIKLCREGTFTELSVGKGKHWLKQFNLMIFSPGSNKTGSKDNTSMYLLLNHPSPDIRVTAVKILAKGAKAGEYDLASTSEQMLSRLKDDDEYVVNQVLACGKALVKYVEPEPLFEVLLDLVYKDRVKSREDLCPIFLGFLEEGVRLRWDLENIHFFEILNQTLLCKDTSKEIHLKNLSELLKRTGADKINPWMVLSRACSDIDLEHYVGEDVPTLASNLLTKLVDGLLDNCHVIKMIDSVWNHGEQGPSDSSPLWLVNVVAAKVLRLGKANSCAMIPLVEMLLKHKEGASDHVTHKELLVMMIQCGTVDEIESMLIKEATKNPSEQPPLTDICLSLLLMKSINIHLKNLGQEGIADGSLYKCRVHLFRLLCLRGSEKKSKNRLKVQTYRMLLQDCLTSHFNGNEAILEFLFQILSETESLDWMFGKNLTPHVTECSLFALHVMASLLRNADAAKLDSDRTLKQVRIFLIYLVHPTQVIREASLSCLSGLHEVLTTCEDDKNSIDNIVEAVVRQTETIKPDSNRIYRVLGKYFKVLRKKEDEASVDTPSKRKTKRTGILKSLLNTKDEHVLFSFLYIAHEVSCGEIFDLIIAETRRILAEGKSRELTDLEYSYLMFVVERLPEISMFNRIFQKSVSDIILNIILLEHPKRSCAVSLLEAAVSKIPIQMGILEAFQDQMSLLMAVLDTIFVNKNIELSSKLKQTLNEVNLTTHHFQSLFESAFDMLEEGPTTPKRPRRASIMSAAENKLRRENAWQLILVTLEEIHHRENFEEAEKLVPFYFRILKGCNEDKSSVPSVEYMKQLSMGCLSKVTTATASAKTKVLIQPNDFNVEQIIGCIRNSEDHHTHQQALLVLGRAASLFPDLVLHNMMAIFTFMGSSVLRQDDAYSFEIIKDTISLVVPALIGVDSKSQQAQIKKLVIGVFADAAPYIPNHRRLTLFTHLADVLGAEENLHIILTLLLTRGLKSRHKAGEQLHKEEALPDDLCEKLICGFPPNIAMIALGKLVRVVTALMSKEEEGGKASKEITQQERQEILSLFDPSTHSGKEFRYFVYLAITMTSGVLGNQTLMRKVQDLQSMDHQIIEEAYLSLLKELLAFVKEEGKLMDSSENESVIKFRKAVIHKGCSIIDKIDDGLKFETFIRVFKNLVCNESHLVQRKAVELVSEKIKKVSEISPEQKNELVPLIDVFIGIIQSTSVSPECLQNKQMALLAVKAFMSRLGEGNAEKFISSIPAILQCSENIGRLSPFNASAMLCLAELCSVFPVQMIEHLNPVVLKITSNFDISTNTRDHYVSHSAFTAAIKVVEAMPQFLSPYLPDLIYQSCLPNIDLGSVPTQLKEKTHELRLSLGSHIPARVLFASMTGCLDHINKSNAHFLTHCMEILAQSLSNLTNADVQTHMKSLHEIFIKALQYRFIRSDRSPADIINEENAVVATYCQHVMKLSENSFRPLFWKVFNWATEDDGPEEHLVAFFHLCCGIAGKLKSLFLLFAKQVIKTAQGILESFTSRTDLRPFKDHPFADDSSSQLIEFILECLTKCFTYDRMGFIGKEDFEFLIDALVDQVENEIGSSEMFQRRTKQYLAPCVRSFVTVVHDESCWRTLNYRILVKTKSERLTVRLAAFDLLSAVQAALKENFASLLPETIPFLAERMEDENFDVEKKCQEFINQLEGNLGESLQKYF